MWLRSEFDLVAATSSVVSDASVSASPGLRPLMVTLLEATFRIRQWHRVKAQYLRYKNNIVKLESQIKETGNQSRGSLSDASLLEINRWPAWMRVNTDTSFSYLKWIELTGCGFLSDTKVHRHLEISCHTPVPPTVGHLQSSHSHSENTGHVLIKCYGCSIDGSLPLPHTRATHSTPLCFYRILIVTFDGGWFSDKSWHLLMIHIKTRNIFKNKQFHQ